MNLFTISEFAKLRNININSLRYYEKIGVLKPFHVDEQTGYRYYSSDQLPILDVILLCLDFGMPLKELKTYIDPDLRIQNHELFEAGLQITKERVLHAQTELNKIHYTLQFLQANQQYSEQTGFYERKIPERKIVVAAYTGALSDVRCIETAAAALYEYAQGKQLTPVFPAGMLVKAECGQIAAKLFFEIMAKDSDDLAVKSIPAGTFLCHQLDLEPDVQLSDAIRTIYGETEQSEIILSNMLLEQYQIGTKKCELQKQITAAL